MIGCSDFLPAQALTPIALCACRRNKARGLAGSTLRVIDHPAGTVRATAPAARLRRAGSHAGLASPRRLARASPTRD
jgi:hypothetical protein